MCPGCCFYLFCFHPGQCYCLCCYSHFLDKFSRSCCAIWLLIFFIFFCFLLPPLFLLQHYYFLHRLLMLFYFFTFSAFPLSPSVPDLPADPYCAVFKGSLVTVTSPTDRGCVCSSETPALFLACTTHLDWAPCYALER